MTDKLISDLTEIASALGDGDMVEVLRSGQTTSEHGLMSDLKTYIQSWLTKAMVGLGNVSNALQLVAANNLSDVSDPIASRANLQMSYGAARTRFYAFTDFMFGYAFTGTPYEAGMQIVFGGTGAVATQLTNIPAPAIGVVSLDLGTTSTGRCGFGQVVSAANEVFRFGQGRTRFASRAAIHVLSNATDTFTTWMGFINRTTLAPTTGAFFRYTDSVNGGKWQAVATTGGTETANDTGVTPVADTFQRFEIDVNAAGTSVVFSIDGTIVATITTNIPIGSNLTGYGVLALKSAGTTATSGLYLDYIEVEQLLTTSR